MSPVNNGPDKLHPEDRGFRTTVRDQSTGQTMIADVLTPEEAAKVPRYYKKGEPPENPKLN